MPWADCNAGHPEVRKTCHSCAWGVRARLVCPHWAGANTRVQFREQGLRVSLNVGAGRDLGLFNPHKSQAGKQSSPKVAAPRPHR